MRLHRYFAARFLRSFLSLLAVFFLFLAFLDLIDQITRFGETDARFATLVQLTLLNVPQALYRILPLITVLATIALFLALARSSEMVVTRAAGRSALRALMAPLAVALIIGVVAVALVNPIVAATSKEYEARATELRGASQSLLAVAGDGLWLRQGSAGRQTVIRADAASLEGTELTGVSFIVFDDDGRPVQRIAAARATLTPGAWRLEEAKIWPLDAANPEAVATTRLMYEIPSTLTRDQIRDSFGTPASIPIWELPRFIERLERAGFSARRHLVWFHMELALPAFLVSMLLVSAGLTMRHQRGGRTGLYVLTAVMLGFGLYFLRNLAQILGGNGQVPAVLAAWAPPVAAILLSLGLLLHLEDG